MTQQPQQPWPTAVPVCYRHPQRETYVRCTRCDRPICPDCMREASVGHQCPECVADGRRTQRPAQTAFGGSRAGQGGYATITLIAINVLVAIAAFVSGGTNSLGGGGLGGLLGGSTPLHQWAALITQPLGRTADGQIVVLPGGLIDGEYYRLFTSMFLHYGLLHLAFNMWALWVLGRALESMLGPVRFLALYLVSGLGGSVAVYLFANPHVQTAGASGAIFGLFAALIVLLRKMRLSVAGVVPVLIINLIFTFSVPGISIAGHLGGMVTGALVAAGLAYAPRPIRTQVQVAAVGATLLILAALTVWHSATLSLGPPA
jgi:membrane associated rhomboid family serine protease